ncbi:hypothetical protein Ahy_B02g057534 [Arachis hypogaea]|uniref:Disease resistance R13L4/SHOC-2-like LRR domain-containing protein n=1 Tax=Arachis hypogaea TaxID=3818 RepID=A0A445AC48_ARAHY|nr:hypothetical protein Ahy_B02g057534 [Arachis hypogaea]
MELSSFPDDCFATMKKHLRFLFLENCPSLKKLPDSICKLQSLQSLRLYCDSLQELPKNMNKLIYLQYLLLMKIKITSLSSMNIGRFQQLKFLYLFNCSKLVSVPSAVGRLTTLKKLGFFWCEELMNFEDEEEEGKQHVVVNNLNLQLFFIIGSKKLDFLPKWLERATKLQYLSIDKTGIKSLPTRLPMTSLEELYIYRCEELSSLPNMDQTHNLQYLVVYNCPALYARYNKETGPDWSKIAHIPHCKVFNLEEMKFTSLPDNCFAKMKKHLRYLNLKGCSSLKTLPNSICDLQNLQCLNLPKCYNLQELPTNMKNLISLQYFFLTVKVTSLSSMNIGHFRQLKFLFLWYCTKLVYVPSAVGRLTALKKLVIHWCTELVNFEGEEEEKKKNVAAYSLNLQVLVINGSFKLEALSDWLYRATKLRYLRIWGGRMESFPTCFPSNSLEELQYISCRLLSFLPNNLDQFHNLQFLEIEDCPILSARYNRKTGLNLKKIAHIPHCEVSLFNF